MKQLLLSEKYRPKTMEDIILLPRIKKAFENGLNENVILYGHFGTGKTSLARILIGRYTKDSPKLEINSSFYTSIDVLRSKIDDFCSKVYMGLDMSVDIKADSMKYVFLDEFERTSQQYQDALKAYIEEYSAKNVRFILVTNHINKVSKGILSRFSSINFDCQDANEEKMLKTLFYKRIQEVIAPAEGFEISKEDLSKIINKNFPDFRQTLIALDHFRRNGEISMTSNIDIKKRDELFRIALGEKKSFDEIYHFIMDNFGAEKVDEMISLLSRPFVDYVIANNPNQTENLFKACNVVTDHTRLLETNTDPLILGITVLSRIREVFI
jgi:DNA polymerase III delta prime subunit